MDGAVYVLDACAVIAALNGEGGADKVKDLLTACEAHEITLYMSTAQVLEVYYDRIYTVGQELADVFLADLFSSAIIVEHYFSIAEIIKAGQYKTTYDLSFADAICLAAAACKSVTLITSDHHELDPVEEAEQFPFLWIRPKPEPKPPRNKADLRTVTAERDQAIQALAEASRRIAELEAKK
jgi:predicted nucleic acid-binding protein